MSTLQPQDVAYCRSINKQHGANYFFATQLFPKDIREATYVLYAFFRVPDDMVDIAHAQDAGASKASLLAWKTNWENAYAGESVDEPVLRATAHIFHTYNIPTKYADAFLDAMIQDTHKTRYQTYEELEAYMYGSAAVVGLMMSHVIGFRSNKALPLAEDLGYAMQLTNFLRDIEEDVVERNRIYMPLNELKQFGVSEDDIIKRRFTPQMDAFMTYQIERARTLYQRAATGIPMLHKRGRFAVRLASVLYSAILVRLEAQGNNPFAGKARTRLTQKLHLLTRVCLNPNKSLS